MNSVNAGEMAIVFPICAIGPLLIVAIWWIVTHNRFVQLDALLRESWANVDVALKRRHDLIPNLVETVKGYAAHERDLFESISKARGEAMASMTHADSRSTLKQHENEISRGLTTLMARAEAYPELKASIHFLELQRELANTEDRIAAARRFYNGNVRAFNTMLEQFPSSLLKGGRTHQDYFEIEDVSMRETPRVGLNP